MSHFIYFTFFRKEGIIVIFLHFYYSSFPAFKLIRVVAREDLWLGLDKDGHLMTAYVALRYCGMISWGFVVSIFQIVSGDDDWYVLFWDSTLCKWILAFLDGEPACEEFRNFRPT